jgi:hypothetical protein
VFLKDQIPTSIAAGAYVLLAAISVVAIPHIFRQLKPKHVVWAYAVAPVFAFCNAYGTGLTDWSLSSSYGKLAIFIFGASIGAENGGVVAGLAACGLMMGIVSTASDLIQDFKTGYLTLTSPRSMFVSQVGGRVFSFFRTLFAFLLQFTLSLAPILQYVYIDTRSVTNEWSGLQCNKNV